MFRATRIMYCRDENLSNFLHSGFFPVCSIPCTYGTVYSTCIPIPVLLLLSRLTVVVVWLRRCKERRCSKEGRPDDGISDRGERKGRKGFGKEGGKEESRQTESSCCCCCCYDQGATCRPQGWCKNHVVVLSKSRPSHLLTFCEAVYLYQSFGNNFIHVSFCNILLS